MEQAVVEQAVVVEQVVAVEQAVVKIALVEQAGEGTVEVVVCMYCRQAALRKLWEMAAWWRVRFPGVDTEDWLSLFDLLLKQAAKWVRHQ
jgi:hypothetical protein